MWPQVADALQQPFTTGTFDLVWSMESGEHMPEKPCVYDLWGEVEVVGEGMAWHT